MDDIISADEAGHLVDLSFELLELFDLGLAEEKLVLDDIPVKEDSKNARGHEDGNHDDGRGDGSGLRKVGELDPAEQNHVQREEEDGRRVGQDPGEVDIPAKRRKCKKNLAKIRRVTKYILGQDIKISTPSGFYLNFPVLLVFSVLLRFSCFTGFTKFC